MRNLIDFRVAVGVPAHAGYSLDIVHCAWFSADGELPVTCEMRVFVDGYQTSRGHGDSFLTAFIEAVRDWYPDFKYQGKDLNAVDPGLSTVNEIMVYMVEFIHGDPRGFVICATDNICKFLFKPKATIKNYKVWCSEDSDSASVLSPQIVTSDSPENAAISWAADNLDGEKMDWLISKYRTMPVLVEDEGVVSTFDVYMTEEVNIHATLVEPEKTELVEQA
jgi:hypothetical protein